MADGTINRVTVYKLKIKNFRETKFPYYKMVKDAYCTLEGKKYRYKLYFGVGTANIAKWYDVFKNLNLSVSNADIPRTQSAGFILIVKVGRSSFYCVTGGGAHNVLTSHVTIEQRFGIILAQTILSNLEFKGLVQKEATGLVAILDRVFRRRYNPEGDIRNFRRILTHIRAKLDPEDVECATIGKSILAGNSLCASGEKCFRDIVSFLVKVDKLYQKRDTKKRIPELEPIDKKLNARLLKQLNSQLVKVLSKGVEKSGTNLFLDNEEMGYLPDQVQSYQLHFGRGFLSPCATYYDLFEVVQKKLEGLTGQEMLKAFNKMKLTVEFENGESLTKNLFYFICGDITYKKEDYFIVNKSWFKASNEFLIRVDAEIDNIEYIEPNDLDLIVWDKTKYKTEAEFNNANKSFIVLDRRLVIMPKNVGDIEFCDLLKDKKDKFVYLVHVKKASGASLRGLFAQGAVSAVLYAQSLEFRQRLHRGKIRGRLDQQAIRKLRDLSGKHRYEFKVIYAIFDDTPSHTVSGTAKLTSQKLKGTLSTFAKVDLLERVMMIGSIGYHVAVTRIKPYP